MGANQGRAKGNKQEAEYRNREGTHERSGGGERGKRKKRKRKEVEPREARKRKLESKGEPEEASAEIEAGGRRKEIADETIR